MKAAQIDNYGDETAIQVRETEKPSVKDGQVLIEVGAASLNPFDLMVLGGHVQDSMPLHFPATLGLDVAGVVLEVGTGVSGVTVGDRVYGSANVLIGASGAFAEFAVTDAKNVALAPQKTTDRGAASLVLVGVSALQALVNTLNIQKGQRLFINGGAGGIGSIAIQIAKSLGAYVITTASADNADYVTELGADEVIDYKTQKITELIKDVDIAFDTVGGDSLNDVLHVIKKGGAATTMAGQFDKTKAEKQEVTVSSMFTKASTESLDILRELVDKGAVHPTIGRTYQLDEIRDAYTALMTESIRGKIVISIHKTHAKP